jgi:hypothetical protein
MKAYGRKKVNRKLSTNNGRCLSPIMSLIKEQDASEQEKEGKYI